MNRPENINSPEVQKECLLEIAEKLYSPEMPYHNFEHAKDTIEAAKKIIERCKEEGLELDEEVVYYAMLFHDAGYHENHEKLGFRSKEEYSAHLADQEMTKVKIPDEKIKEVVKTILATHSQAPFVTVEQKIARAADLSGMAAEYELFVENNIKLKKEQELIDGKEISLEAWKQKTKEVIEFYLSQDIHLTDGYQDEEGNSIFHNKVKENLARFLKEEEI
ncbi:MAG: HD domain-containing protein [Candidatus Kerfeldbacteria bacterium]